MKNKERFNISIEVGIATSFIFLVLVTSISLSMFIAGSVKQTMREDLQKQLHHVVSVGSLLINGDDLDLLEDKNQESSPNYLAVKNKLQAVRDSSLDVRYVYTMRFTPEQKFLFIVDAEENPEEMSHIGDEYLEPTELLREIFLNPNAVYVESTFNTDQWGTWISGYAPIWNASGELAGILGADMSAQKVVEYERRILATIVVTSILVTVIVSIIGFKLSKKITRPLKLLEEDLTRVGYLELDTPIQLHTIFKEVRSVQSTAENMKSGLRSFMKYVPATLVRQLVALQKEATLAMEKKELTILFTDIADFATISEKIPLDHLGNTMTDYLTNLTQIVHQQQGTIDKYIGDSVMAFWGAPVEIDNQALLACEAALQCQQFLQGFNAEMAANGEYGFITRMGIHTGEVLVGNIGAEDRFNYTVIGDPVNVASRLEGLNKNYGTSIMISETTYTHVKEEMVARLVDKVIVKGKHTGLLIYELISRIDSSSAQTIAFVQSFNKGMGHYFAQEWSLALEQFSKCLDIDAADPMVVAMIDRCQSLAEVAPDQDWTGITKHYFK